MPRANKSYHESFARFFETPTREAFRDLIRSNIGELRSCDFKVSWTPHASLAKHVLGLANTEGGCIVFGVAESDDGALESVGLRKLADKADVSNGLKGHIPEALLRLVDVVDFAFEASEYPGLVGKRFQVLFVEDDPTHLPFVALSDGKSIRRGAVYYRSEGITEEATYDQLQEIINRRLATGHSTQREMDLKTHLDQLNALYSAIARANVTWGSSLAAAALAGMSVPNPKYPKEDFESFVVRMIRDKKLRIQRELDVP